MIKTHRDMMMMDPKHALGVHGKEFLSVYLGQFFPQFKQLTSHTYL